MKLLSLFCRCDRISSERWIKALIDECTTNPTEEFPLPKGEGQGEWKPRSITQPRVISRRVRTKWFHFEQRNHAMTLLEILVVLAVITILAAVILPPMMRPHPYRGIQCVNNLKQIGLSFRIWEGDHGDKYPSFVSWTNGGSMEFRSGLNAFRHFQVMSNELSTPKVLMCPQETDAYRFLAPDFVTFNNSNISFFVGVDATEANPQMILSGDHNITNGISIRNGLLDLTTNRPAGWTEEMHNKSGNLCLVDGSVQMVSVSGLRQTVTNTGLPTNWLQMPVVQ
jgi:prepilin-type N-terminal cleavage/methylation domain-containing protein